MKKQTRFLNIVLVITLLGGLLFRQPVQDAQALHAKQTQEGSPERIAYIAEDGNVWLMYSDGTGNNQLTFDGGYYELAWSPDGQRLALTKGTTSDRTRPLYLKDLSANPPKKLADNVYIFAWSPHGDQIAYSSDQIYIVSVNSAEADIIIPEKYPYKWLFWNSTGENLIYYLYDTGSIYSFNVTTKETISLYPADDNAPRRLSFEELEYSPTSGHFFGWDYQSEGTGIPVIIKSDGQLLDLGEDTVQAVISETTNVIVIPVTGYPSADWSPNGKRIAYGDNWQFGNGHLFIADVAPYKLSVVPGQGINPRWSPDGKLIAFVAERGGLNLLDVESQQITTLLPDVSDEYLYEICGFGGCFGYSSTEENEPLWAPDGRSIVLPYKLGFFIYDLKTMKSEWLEGGLSPQWQPTKTDYLLPIKDLVVQPGHPESSVEKETKGIAVTFLWSDPEKRAASQVVDRYEIRFADFPLTDNNWNQGQVLPEPDVKTDSSNRWETFIPITSIRKELYFAIRYYRPNIGWSPVSNVIKYTDLGFRPELDGFKFSNTDEQWGTYRYNDPESLASQDFTEEDMYTMFGDSICWGENNDGTCRLRPSARLWLRWANEGTISGHCVGMATASLLIYKEPSQMSNLEANSEQVYSDAINLEVGPTRKFITYYFVEQFALPYLTYKHTSTIPLKASPSEVLDQIHDGILNGDFHQLNLELKDSPKTTAWHSVVPFAISESDEISTIYIYDNNAPGAIRPITIDRKLEKWAYGEQGSDLFPNLSSGMFSVPLSIFTTQQRPPWDVYSIASIINGSIDSSYVANELGQQLGVVDGMLETQIPEGNILPILNASNYVSNFMYVLPLEDKYTVHYSGTEDKRMSTVTFFSGNSGLIINNVIFPNAAEDLLNFSTKGPEFSYRSSQGQDLSVQYVVETQKASYLFRFSELTIDAGNELIVRINEAGEQLVLSLASNNSFDLNFDRIMTSGESKFSHSDILFLNAKAIAFELGAWNGYGPLSAQIDYDGDGEYDETVQIGNEGSLLGALTSKRQLGIVFWGFGFMLFLIGTIGLLLTRKK